MTWAWLAVSATTLWGASVLIDKYVLGRVVENALVPLVIHTIVQAIAGGVALVAVGLPDVSFATIAIAGMIGLSTFVGSVFYYQAVKREEISRIVPLYATMPLFVAFGAVIFLGEYVGTVSYAGVVLLVCGALLITWRPGVARLSSGFLFVAISLALYASSELLAKYTVGSLTAGETFGLARFANILVLPGVLYVAGKELAAEVRNKGARVWVAIGISEGLSVLGMYLGILALTTGLVTLVNALFSLQPLLVLAGAVAISYFAPHIIKESIDRRTVGLKIVAILLLTAGVILVT